MEAGSCHCCLQTQDSFLKDRQDGLGILKPTLGCFPSRRVWVHGRVWPQILGTLEALLHHGLTGKARPCRSCTECSINPECPCWWGCPLPAAQSSLLLSARSRALQAEAWCKITVEQVKPVNSILLCIVSLVSYSSLCPGLISVLKDLPLLRKIKAMLIPSLHGWAQLEKTSLEEASAFFRAGTAKESSTGPEQLFWVHSDYAETSDS